MNGPYYSTPDGSVWEESVHETGYFNRISGPGADDDFRAQSLFEVLSSWGALKLHDPLEHQAHMLNKALSANFAVTREELPMRMAQWLGKVGYEVRKKDE